MKKRDQDIARAVVQIAKLGGQGVLIPGNFILTAAHCIDFSTTGRMVLGDLYVEEIKTIQGQSLLTQPLYVEPISDIALLGALDPQEFEKESEDFETFCENIKAVPLCFDEFPLFEDLPIQIYTHKQKWIEGKAQQCAYGARVLFFESLENIEGGTSGSPAVNAAGKIVGIMNQAGGNEGLTRNGLMPRPHMTLPVWAISQIKNYQ